MVHVFCVLIFELSGILIFDPSIPSPKANAMSITTTLDKFRAHLVIGMLTAGSVNTAKKFLQQSVQTLKEKNIAKDTLESLLDKISNQLQQVTTMTGDKQQIAILLGAIVSIAEMRAKL